jgi:hypothetical protein
MAGSEKPTLCAKSKLGPSIFDFASRQLGLAAMERRPFINAGYATVGRDDTVCSQITPSQKRCILNAAIDDQVGETCCATLLMKKTASWKNGLPRRNV